MGRWDSFFDMNNVESLADAVNMAMGINERFSKGVDDGDPELTHILLRASTEAEREAIENDTYDYYCGWEVDGDMAKMVLGETDLFANEVARVKMERQARKDAEKAEAAKRIEKAQEARERAEFERLKGKYMGDK